MTDFGADPALVASQSNPQAVSTKGFDPGERLEFRPDSRGDFDEIVARFADGMVHAEMMSDKSCYVGFYWDDGRYCQWWFGTKKGKLWNNHEDGHGEPPRFTAWGIDTRPDEPDPLAPTETGTAETQDSGSVAQAMRAGKAPKSIGKESDQ